jgi:hypothetical protein
VPQASAVDEPIETGRLPRRQKPKRHSVADAGPSRDMRTDLPAEGIPVDDCSQLG